MKTALHTMGTPRLSVREAAELAARVGFDGIEIIWDDDYYSALRKDETESELSTFLDLLESLRLQVACLTPYMTGINSPDVEERDRAIADFERCINVAARLRAGFIRVYGGGLFPNEETELKRKKETLLLESLAYLGDVAAQAGVTLAVETHFNTMTDTASETSRIVRNVDHPAVQVLYDQPNLDFYGAEEYGDALSLLQGLIAYVHVKDFVFKEGVDGTFVSSHVANIDKSDRKIMSRVPGEGVVAWPEIMAGLQAQAYDGWLSFEYERRWYPEDLPEPEPGFSAGLRYISSLLER